MRKTIEWTSAYSYVIVPKAVETQEVQLSKFKIYDEEDNSLVVGYDSIKSLSEATKDFTPFPIIDDRFIACRFPLTANEAKALPLYLTSIGLVDISDDGTAFGIATENIDFTNVPDNGFLIVMVTEMKDVPKAIEDETI